MRWLRPSVGLVSGRPQALYLIPEGAASPGLSLGIVDAGTRENSVYLKHPHDSLARAVLARRPLDQLHAFTTTPVGKPGVNRIVIAPFRSPGGPLESDWVVVAQETSAGQGALVLRRLTPVLHVRGRRLSLYSRSD